MEGETGFIFITKFKFKIIKVDECKTAKYSVLTCQKTEFRPFLNVPHRNINNLQLSIYRVSQKKRPIVFNGL